MSTEPDPEPLTAEELALLREACDPQYRRLPMPERALIARLLATPSSVTRDLRAALTTMATRWEREADERNADPKASAASLLAVGILRSHAQSVRALASVTPSEPTLDAAWNAVQDVLPEGWTLELGDWRAEPNRREGIAPFEAVAQPYVRHNDGNDPMRIGRGWTPPDALSDLAASFRAVQHER